MSYLTKKNRTPNWGAIDGSLGCKMKLTELLYIFDYILIICDIFITYIYNTHIYLKS